MVECRPKDPGDGCPRRLREGPWPRRVAGSEILVVSPKRHQPGVWAPGRQRSRESGGRNTGVLGREGRRTRPPDAAGTQERAGWSLHSFPDGTSQIRCLLSEALASLRGQPLYSGTRLCGERGSPRLYTPLLPFALSSRPCCRGSQVAQGLVGVQHIEGHCSSTSD